MCYLVGWHWDWGIGVGRHSAQTRVIVSWIFFSKRVISSRLASI